MLIAPKPTYPWPQLPLATVGGAANKPKEVQIELVQMDFGVHIETDDPAVKARVGTSPLKVWMSKVQTVGNCLQQICAQWELPTDKVRLWDYYSSTRYSRLENLEATVASVPLYPGQLLLVEHQKSDGSWHFPDETPEAGSMDLFDGVGSTGSSSAPASSSTAVGSSSRTVTTFGGASSSAVRQDTVVDTSTPQHLGVVGLSNL